MFLNSFFFNKKKHFNIITKHGYIRVVVSDISRNLESFLCHCTLTDTWRQAWDNILRQPQIDSSLDNLNMTANRKFNNDFLVCSPAIAWEPRALRRKQEKVEKIWLFVGVNVILERHRLYSKEPSLEYGAYPCRKIFEFVLQ